MSILSFSGLLAAALAIFALIAVIKPFGFLKSRWQALGLLLVALLAFAGISMEVADQNKKAIHAVVKSMDRLEREKSLNEYREKAINGHYIDWRNMAFALSSGDASDEDRIQACAWRIAIISSKNPKIDTGDEGNLEMDCNQRGLTEAQISKASDEAKRIILTLKN